MIKLCRLLTVEGDSLRLNFLFSPTESAAKRFGGEVRKENFQTNHLLIFSSSSIMTLTMVFFRRKFFIFVKRKEKPDSIRRIGKRSHSNGVTHTCFFSSFTVEKCERWSRFSIDEWSLDWPVKQLIRFNVSRIQLFHVRTTIFFSSTEEKAGKSEERKTLTHFARARCAFTGRKITAASPTPIRMRREEKWEKKLRHYGWEKDSTQFSFSICLFCPFVSSVKNSFRVN